MLNLCCSYSKRADATEDLEEAKEACAYFFLCSLSVFIPLFGLCIRIDSQHV